MPCNARNDHFYQDRLGTNIGETQKRGCFFFQRFDLDADGYHNYKETRALGAALQLATPVSRADYAGLCADVRADPHAGISLRQFTVRVHTTDSILYEMRTRTQYNRMESMR
jgi:hypothetical protein